MMEKSTKVCYIPRT